MPMKNTSYRPAGSIGIGISWGLRPSDINIQITLDRIKFVYFIGLASCYNIRTLNVASLKTGYEKGVLTVMVAVCMVDNGAAGIAAPIQVHLQLQIPH